MLPTFLTIKNEQENKLRIEVKTGGLYISLPCVSLQSERKMEIVY